jgi:hypothetical protein
MMHPSAYQKTVPKTLADGIALVCFLLVNTNDAIQYSAAVIQG